MASPRAIILAIGTEITEGQILNRNAAWLSEHLVSIGFDVVRHEAVADDRPEIVRAFERAEQDADLLIVTGGLGPTSDDFTRECISSWAGAPLAFSDASWARVNERLSSRGVEVSPSNRQQCYFPESAEVFPNPNGTADAFFLQVRKLATYALPGPPSEIEGLWKKSVESHLLHQFPHLVITHCLKWKCLGKSESALGEIVEKALDGIPYRRGYRVALPYIEVKLWIPEDELPTPLSAQARGALDRVLAPYAIAKNDADLALHFVRQLSALDPSRSILIIDAGNNGALSSRIHPVLKTAPFESLRARLELLTRFVETDTPEQFPEISPSEWIFALLPQGKAVVISHLNKSVHEIDSPYTSPELRDRLNGYRTEKSLAFFSGVLDKQG